MRKNYRELQSQLQIQAEVCFYPSILSVSVLQAVGRTCVEKSFCRADPATWDICAQMILLSFSDTPTQKRFPSYAFKTVARILLLHSQPHQGEISTPHCCIYSSELQSNTQRALWSVVSETLGTGLCECALCCRLCMRSGVYNCQHVRVSVPHFLVKTLHTAQAWNL